MPIITSSTNNFDNLSKTYIKKTIKQYVDKPLQIGSSFLQISKASEKWITLTESRKGLVQEHRRNSIDNILEYIHYKKTLFFKDDTESAIEIDPAKQSKQYQTQHENYLEIKQDFQTHLEVIFKNYTKLIAFSIDEENGIVTIKLNHDKQIVLTLPKPNTTLSTLENISISTNHESLNEIVNNIAKYKFFEGYFHVTSMLYNNTKESIHFITTLKKLIAFKKQLKLLVSFVDHSKILDDSSNEDLGHINAIKHYLKHSKKGDDLTLEYDEFASNGMIFKRTFVIHKITKIRTTVRTIAIQKIDNLDQENNEIQPKKYVEYSKTFTKIHQDLDKITSEIYNLYLANT